MSDTKKTCASGDFQFARIKKYIFAAVAVLHVVIILTAAFNIETAVQLPQPVAGVMNLVDVRERIPPPPPAPPPPEPERAAELNPAVLAPQLTQNLIAEIFIEVDEVPAPAAEPLPPQTSPGPAALQFLPPNRVSALAVLPEDQIRRATIYPPIARRAGIEGIVYLDLFIDSQGYIKEIRILREVPANRGFGEAALNAFRDVRARPAELNGVPVASRFRYSISFRLE